MGLRDILLEYPDKLCFRLSELVPRLDVFSDALVGSATVHEEEAHPGSNSDEVVVRQELGPKYTELFYHL